MSCVSVLRECSNSIRVLSSSSAFAKAPFGRVLSVEQVRLKGTLSNRITFMFHLHPHRDNLDKLDVTKLSN